MAAHMAKGKFVSTKSNAGRPVEPTSAELVAGTAATEKFACDGTSLISFW